MSEPSDPASSERWQRIRAKLEAVRPQLVRNGKVRARREPTGVYWQVRYAVREGGRERQPAVYLGHEAYARLAKRLIGRWRREAITPAQRTRDETARLIELSGTARGYSRRAMKRLRVATQAAMEDPREALKFVIGLRRDDDAIRNGRRRGRPPKRGVW